MSTAQNLIAVIDYGMGNLHSVSKALEKVGGGAKVVVTADADVIRSADRVVFPGVGAIRDCVGEIKRLGFDKLVAEVCAAGTPVLAVCVGMQALMDFSEENNGVECIGLCSGVVRYFGDGMTASNGERLKVPHMGWNTVRHEVAHPLWKDIADDSRFYFVHSYFVDPSEASQIAATVEYGSRFCAVIARDNLFAVQFHPEKSSDPGLTLLRNFVQWDGRC